jgi:hypothetical protein
MALDERTLEGSYRAAIENRRTWCGANGEGATATFGAVLPTEEADPPLGA